MNNERFDPPRLLAGESACNVVKFRGNYYALPHSLGPVELEKQNVAEQPGVLVTKSEKRGAGLCKAL